MRLTAMDISFKYTAGKINVEQTFHIEFEPNEKVEMTGWIRDKATLLEQAGFEPAVVKQHRGLGSPTARQHGANGSTYDDLEPELDGNGRQRHCPDCHEPLYRKSWVFKSGQNKGQPGWMICHATKTKCAYVGFENR